MKRQIIHIDEEKCNGCGLCVNACHESALALVNGKAKLIRDDYCDGMGDCLPECPTGAITFEEREADAYDAKAVAENMRRMKLQQMGAPQAGGGCPGSRMMDMRRQQPPVQLEMDGPSAPKISLGNWPVQIKLAPVQAPYYQDADLLIAADCTAFAYSNFHQEFIKGRTVLIGCPKLDAVDYSEKLAQIIAANDIRTITLTRMTVPCCGGLMMAVKRAVAMSGKEIPVRVVVVGIDGELVK